MGLLRTATLLTLCGLIPRVGAAQRAGTLEFGAAGAWHNWTSPNNLSRGFGALGRIAVWLPAGFTVEGELTATRPLNWDTSTHITLLTASGSLLFNVPVGERSLYLRGGVARLRGASPCRAGGEPCHAFSAATGAFGFRFPVANSVQLRGEAMLRSRPGYHYTSVGANLGVTFLTKPTRGGGRTEADDDLDGVPNRRDRCRATPRGALVDVRGCPTDFDGDGAFDGIDRCPATPKGTPVDRFGCPVRPPD